MNKRKYLDEYIELEKLNNKSGERDCHRIKYQKVYTLAANNAKRGGSRKEFSRGRFFWRRMKKLKHENAALK